MSKLRISLFKKLHVASEGQPLSGLDGRKVQELFCYLLLHRQRLHSRESLADLLWEDSSSAQTRKYLRQALWQLQTIVTPHMNGQKCPILLVDAEWIGVNPEYDMWLDVAEFEETTVRVRGVPGHQLTREAAQDLEKATDLYQGDLLENWYQDWCVYERVRLQDMYTTALDKLMSYCEAAQDYEAGLVHGERILHFDRAHERTHRRMMRLMYLAGDRTRALRQYERCVTALDEELGVKPSQSTLSLYARVREGMAVSPSLAQAVAEAEGQWDDPEMPQGVDQLKRIQAMLTDLQYYVQRVLRDAGMESG